MEGQVALALEDFVPVVLSALGVFLLAGKIARVDQGLGRLAYLGFGLITAGGLSKAVWKLLFATMGMDIVWLDNSLFILLAPGFICLAWALVWEQRLSNGQERPRSIWIGPFVLTAITGAVAVFLATLGGRGWSFHLLGVTTLGTIVAIVVLVRQSVRRKMLLVGFLFVLNLFLTLVLAGMARIPDQTVGLQWIEQLINTGSQGAFAYGAWRLQQAV